MKKEISIFHHFKTGPYGGANQFVVALQQHLQSNGVKVLQNKITRKTSAILLNAFLFNTEEILHIKNKYPKIKIIHRVDGPIGIYRGESIDIDLKIQEINHKLAHATILQSIYSKQKQESIGLNFIKPEIIHNAANPIYFNRKNKIPFNLNRKIRLVASSWSNNPRKGGPIYKWLDTNLNFDKFEFTYIGRIKETLHNANKVEALASEQLAVELKKHDIYITASMDDPCSNALVEALTCGLPAVYLKSGGHPELVKNGGIGFHSEKELLQAIDDVVDNYRFYQQNIEISTMKEVADKYLNIMAVNCNRNKYQALKKYKTRIISFLKNSNPED